MIRRQLSVNFRLREIRSEIRAVIIYSGIILSIICDDHFARGLVTFTSFDAPDVIIELIISGLSR